ncbi:hypothetical protein [Tenacibaculum sp. 190524A02b]|uniref:hypothetical protein n=1 Tax=Tenacibaculum vairaonense TaxID=3137860 RepID=UPI0031FA8DD6
MMNIFKITFAVVFLTFTQSVAAQLDGSFGGKDKGKTSIGIINSDAKEVKRPESLDFKNNDGFKSAHAKQQQELQKKQAEKALENKGVLTPSLRRQLVLQKKMEKFNLKIPMTDKDMGSFHTTSRNIHINAIDFGRIDGDVISIYKNGIPVFENYTLKRDLKNFSIPLSLGFNKIEIIAINEGDLRPNTGAFTIYDDYKDIVSSDMWNLAKGAKVIAMIIREKEKK